MMNLKADFFKKAAILLLFLVPAFIFAQPSNDECSTARVLANVSNFCSNDGQYTNSDATASFNNSGPDVWLKFTAIAYDINISAGGTGNGGTMRTPRIGLYLDCNGNGLVGSSTTAGNLTTFYRGGLIIGKEYYIQISSVVNNTGTFKLCVNNYTPVPKAGQDYNTASYLCSKEGFRQLNVTGPGSNNDEAAGTCLTVPGLASETNSAWYKWTAANNGSLTFNIVPTVATDDLDWVLYDLGTVDNPLNIRAANVKRCAAGRGVDCTVGQVYFKTGMDLVSTDLTEDGGCGQGQDGFVKYLDMEAGHIYALLVNNFDNSNNGFSIDFGGAGEFLGPQAIFSMQEDQPCTINQNFTFTNQSTNYSTVKWSFGEGANVTHVTPDGPFKVSYSTPGFKTVVLEAYSAQGCFVVASKTFGVGVTPATPVISANKAFFCAEDDIVLSTTPVANTTYLWSGPNNFSSEQPTVSIPADGAFATGVYTLVAMQGNCTSNLSTITVPPIINNPVAAFRTIPTLPAKLSVPVSVEFINQSTGADSYLWDFGDGSTSNDINPRHEYTGTGEFDVTLVAFNKAVCSGTITMGTFVIKPDNTLFVPNTFTPNGDNVNDELVVTITNLRAYHIRIFNRWGEPLFESVNIFENWTGLYKGQPLPVGTYYYVIDGYGLNGNNIKKSGSVTILR